jgi:hypothetical protein
VRHYLFVSQEYDKALPVLRELSQQPDTDETLRAFTLAAECVCHEQLGHKREASEANSQLTTPLRDILIRNENELYVLLQASQSRL